jgi:hypothetical protein
MELGFAISVFDIDGGTTAIAGELARVGAAAEEAGATGWRSWITTSKLNRPVSRPRRTCWRATPLAVMAALVDRCTINGEVVVSASAGQPYRPAGRPAVIDLAPRPVPARRSRSGGSSAAVGQAAAVPPV